MSECGNVTFGLDSENGLKRISVDEAVERYRNKHFYIQCENCKGKLFPKCGTVRSHHFAHSFLKDLEHAPRDIRSTSHQGGPSEWHKRWQRVFPPECRERKDPTYHEDDGRRADVMFFEERVVFEFQKGEFGFDGCKDTCQQRNEFWIGRGYDIIWLFADTESKEENMGFDFSDRVVRMYRPYRDRLLGREFNVSEHIEVHLTFGEKIYQLLPERKSVQDNENVVTYPFMVSYLNAFNPDDQSLLPVIDVKEKLLKNRAEANMKCIEILNENQKEGGARYSNGGKNTSLKKVRESIEQLKKKTSKDSVTLDEIVNRVNEINCTEGGDLQIIWVKNMATNYVYALYPNNQPSKGDMWGYMKRTPSGMYANDRMDIFGRNKKTWCFLG